MQVRYVHIIVILIGTNMILRKQTLKESTESACTMLAGKLLQERIASGKKLYLKTLMLIAG